MRTISTSGLPADLNNLTLIKSTEQKQHRRLVAALERTLSHCSEVTAQYQAQTLQIREDSEKEGFTAGFQHFFSQLITMLDHYEKLQNERFAVFRQELIETVKTSFHDPVIVERIIHYLQEKSGHQKNVKIIIPRQVPLPEGVEISNYQFTDDNHITVQNDSDAIRFPSELLCIQWIDQADAKADAVDQKIARLIPDTLTEIASQLIHLSQPDQTAPSDAPTYYEEDNEYY